jgi:hypothetical protein
MMLRKAEGRRQKAERNQSGFLLAVLIATTLLADVAGSRERRLEIAGSGRVVWSSPIRAGERFDVSFIHSQERTLFVQRYVAGADGTVEQDEVQFGSYGAGMPLEPVARGGDRFTARVQRRLAVVPMLSSRAAQLRLRYRGNDVAIDQWFDDFEPFEIRIR